jgi:hypothetical protein
VLALTCALASPHVFFSPLLSSHFSLFTSQPLSSPPTSSHLCSLRRFNNSLQYLLCLDEEVEKLRPARPEVKTSPQAERARSGYKSDLSLGVPVPVPICFAVCGYMSVIIAAWISSAPRLFNLPTGCRLVIRAINRPLSLTQHLQLTTLVPPTRMMSKIPEYLFFTNKIPFLFFF